MITLLTGLYEQLVQRPERRFLLLGLDNAGKTTILEQMKKNHNQPALDSYKIMPTIGFNVAKLQIGQ